MSWGQRFPHPHLAPKGARVTVDGRVWVVTKLDWFADRDGHPMCGCGWTPLEER